LPPSSSVRASCNPKIEPTVFFSVLIYQTNGIAPFKTMPLLCHTSKHSLGRDSSVGIATGYGLDGQVIEFRRGLDFPHLSRPDLETITPPIQWYRVSFVGVALTTHPHLAPSLKNE
jgi:hypothetical protein